MAFSGVKDADIFTDTAIDQDLVDDFQVIEAMLQHVRALNPKFTIIDESDSSPTVIIISHSHYNLLRYLSSTTNVKDIRSDLQSSPKQRTPKRQRGKKRSSKTLTPAAQEARPLFEDNMRAKAEGELE